MDDRTIARLRYGRGLVQPEEILRAQLTASLTPGSYAAAKLLRYDAGNLVEVGSDDVRVHDALGWLSGGSGDKMYVSWFADAERYEILGALGAPMMLGKLTSDLVEGGSASMNIWAGPAGAETNAGAFDEDVWDWLLTSGDTLPSGTKVIVSRINGFWYVIAASCP